jgi:hypothetical protein
MKTRVIFYALAMAWFLEAYAQAPGYMGKKILVGITCHYSPAFSVIIQKSNINYSGEDVNLMLNSPRLGLTFQYVIAEDKTLNLSMAYQRIGVAAPQPDYSSGSNSSFLHPGQELDYAYASVVTIYAGAFSQRSHVAPVGEYIGNNLCFINTSVEAVDKSGGTYDLGNAWDIGYNLEFGYKRVIADKICVDAGVGMSFYARGLFSFFHQSDDRPLQEQLLAAAMFKNYVNNLCTLKVGVYYLP